MQMATRGETTKSTKHRRVAHRTARFHLALTSCSGRPKIHQRSQSQELFWLIWTCFLPCWPMGVQLPTFNFTWGSWPSTYSIPTSPTHASKRVFAKGLTSTSLMLKDVGICAITSSPSRFLHRTQGISLDRHMAHFATAFVSCHQLSSLGAVSKVPVVFFWGWAQKIKHISVSKQLHRQETILHSPPLHDNSETTFCVRELA